MDRQNTTITETKKLVLKLKKKEKKVTFTQDTVDNEHSDKKKSKVCCISKVHKKGDVNKYERM
ncbi:hypothetical protein TUBRATIS_18010 [Tubulinosema ratisbonensis]|uniref:Type 1 phosphatases regulator n=1 Tax=Tubulinosema ratisbonensis TaxID=291195 RepID=A0A437AKL0_9MICR|nr:hypothetical protein TUBRATIS_18010 [Tubulinosema ratisbonensis]